MPQNQCEEHSINHPEAEMPQNQCEEHSINHPEAETPQNRCAEHFINNAEAETPQKQREENSINNPEAQKLSSVELVAADYRPTSVKNKPLTGTESKTTKSKTALTGNGAANTINTEAKNPLKHKSARVKTEKSDFNAKSSCVGHRKRLKERFDNVGINGMQDYEVVEMLLFYAIARKDTKATAKRLLAKFKTLKKLLWAPHDSVCSVEGVDAAAARLIRFCRELSIRLSADELIESKQEFANSRGLYEYLKATMAGQSEESLRVIFLNAKNVIIKDELFSEGTENQTAVYPKKILKHALDIRSTGIVVVHNHPSGNLQPSGADIAITQKLLAGANALDIRLVDHIIVGPAVSANAPAEYFSFHDNGLIEL